MKRSRSEPRLANERVTHAAVLTCLLILGGFAIAGPSGLIAWGENQKLLKQRRAEIAQLQRERDFLANRVKLLDPRHADPDLAGELLRRNLNVAHPDEMVMLLK